MGLREHDYKTCQDGDGCTECKDHEKQEQILTLLKTRRVSIAGKQAVIKMLKETPKV